MNMQGTLDRLHEQGVIAVLRGPSPELTLKMVEALIEGGIRAIEITYTTPEADTVVEKLVGLHGGDLVVGMGTLRTPEHADRAKGAGAAFVVSPHLEENLAGAMNRTGLVTMFGALTPSEVVRAHALGSNVVKLFPGSLGGPGYLKALRGPLPDIPLMPTGGVSLDNVADWLQAGAFAVGAGSNLCPTDWAREGRFDAISERAAEFVAEIERARSQP